ncbi:MAG: hypothetical protein JW731_07910 [Bacteroidales bacterium]|nr:hypothetical protein [Bacteroidales bacterium]
MKSFYQKLLKKDFHLPPRQVTEGFAKNFNNPVNTEWHKVGDHYEALFHHENIEKLAFFNALGQMTEIRTNQTVSELPEPINDTASRQGEIMNVIYIQKGSQNSYEIIVKQTDFTRKLILISEDNEILKTEIL